MIVPAHARLVLAFRVTAPRCLVICLVNLIFWQSSSARARARRSPRSSPGRRWERPTTSPCSGADSLQERRAVQSAIDRVLVETDRHLSTYDDTSEIALLNRDESRSWQDVSPTLFVVLKEARDVSELTGGSFDVTVAPLLGLWGYEPGSVDASGRTTFQPPTSGQLEQARTSVGYAKLELRTAPRMSVRKSASGMRLTVDGIAPGYAVDRIATELRAPWSHRFHRRDRGRGSCRRATAGGRSVADRDRSAARDRA